MGQSFERTSPRPFVSRQSQTPVLPPPLVTFFRRDTRWRKSPGRPVRSVPYGAESRQAQQNSAGPPKTHPVSRTNRPSALLPAFQPTATQATARDEKKQTESPESKTIRRAAMQPQTQDQNGQRGQKGVCAPCQKRFQDSGNGVSFVHIRIFPSGTPPEEDSSTFSTTVSSMSPQMPTALPHCT